jgi:transposase
MWYNRGYEKPHLYPTAHRGRTPPDPKRGAFVRCLCLASVPDLAGQFSRRTSPRDSPPAWLRRPNRSQGDPRLQCCWVGRAARRLFTPPSPAKHVLRRRMPAITRSLASQPARLWQRARRVDLGTGSTGQFRARDHRLRGVHRKCASSPQTTQNQLEARQALDYQPRPAIPAKKNARDRLIAWASQQPAWAIGFLDEVWWSRFALPRMHAWQDPEHPVRLVEQSWKKGDPDPKALACYGVLWQEGTPDEPRREQMWLRFVSGRPVSAITTQFLDWCCQRLLKGGKTNWLLIWDHASWHKSQAVRTWIREHNQQIKQAGTGVRILPFLLPTQSPWLNPIEPKWVHAKRNVVETDGLLSAHQLAERVCAYFGCSYESHLTIPEKVA